MQKYKVVWTSQAAEDLSDIIEYVSADNRAAASKLFAQMRGRCDKLATNPERCRIIPELKEVGLKKYREVIIKPYRILFKLMGSTVSIFAVVDGRRDFEAFLFERLVRGS